MLHWLPWAPVGRAAVNDSVLAQGSSLVGTSRARQPLDRSNFQRLSLMSLSLRKNRGVLLT